MNPCSEPLWGGGPPFSANKNQLKIGPKTVVFGRKTPFSASFFFFWFSSVFEPFPNLFAQKVLRVGVIFLLNFCVCFLNTSLKDGVNTEIHFILPLNTDAPTKVCSWSLPSEQSYMQEAKSVLTHVSAAIPCQDYPLPHPILTLSNVCERIKTNAFLFPVQIWPSSQARWFMMLGGRCSARICLHSRTHTDGLPPMQPCLQFYCVWAQRCSVCIVWCGYTTATQGGIALAGGELGQGETRRTRNKVPLWPAGEDNAIDKGSQ